MFVFMRNIWLNSCTVCDRLESQSNDSFIHELGTASLSVSWSLARTGPPPSFLPWVDLPAKASRPEAGSSVSVTCTVQVIVGRSSGNFFTVFTYFTTLLALLHRVGNGSYCSFN